MPVLRFQYQPPGKMPGFEASSKSCDSVEPKETFPHNAYFVKDVAVKQRKQFSELIPCEMTHFTILMNLIHSVW